MYLEVFQEGLGTLKHYKATLHCHTMILPPSSIQEQVERELDNLVEKGILQRVDYSDWLAPIVLVPKSDGSIRICGYYKVTINP